MSYLSHLLPDFRKRSIIYLTQGKWHISLYWLCHIWALRRNQSSSGKKR
jgi:hypothetical protein